MTSKKADSHTHCDMEKIFNSGKIPLLNVSSTHIIISFLAVLCNSHRFLMKQDCKYGFKPYYNIIFGDIINSGITLNTDYQIVNVFSLFQKVKKVTKRSKLTLL